MQKVKIHEIADLAFSNIDAKIKEYDTRNFEMFSESMIHKFDKDQINFSLNTDQANSNLLEHIIQTIDNKHFPLKYMGYQESLSGLREFIKLKKFVCNFHEMILQSKEFLLDVKENHCGYLTNCINIMMEFEKLDDYLKNDYKEVSKKLSSSNIFRRYPNLVSQIAEFTLIIDQKKGALHDFILQSIEDHERQLKTFFESFNISTKIEHLKDFISKEQGIQHLFSKVTLHSQIFFRNKQELD